MESTQPTHEADGQEEWGKHMQDPGGETAAPAQSQSLYVDPGANQPVTRDGAATRSQPQTSQGLMGLFRALHFILRARDPASCRDRALFATLEASRCDVEVGRGERGYHGHTGPRGQMVVELKQTLTGLRKRVQVRAKGIGCPDDSWEESPFREMGRWK